MRKNKDELLLPMEHQKVKVKFNTGFLVTLLMVAAIAVLGVLIYKSMTGDKTVVLVPTERTVTNEAIAITPTATPALRPEADGENCLPVFYKAGTEEKKVAVTVMGLTNEEELEILLGQAGTYGAKLTFFLNGEEVSKYESFLGEMVISGHEIESAGYSGKSYEGMTAAEIKNDVDLQTFSLRLAVGESYTPHFLCAANVLDDENEALHSYLKSRGYYGLVRWSALNLSSAENAEPGQIIAMNLSSCGIEVTRCLLASLEEAGYEAVTLNSLFEYEDNFPESASAAG